MEDDLLEKFYEALKSKGYRSITIDEYRRNLNDYTDYLLTVPLYSFFAATVDVVNGYYIATKEKKYTARTAWKKQHAVFAFYEWLKEEGYLLVNPCPRPAPLRGHQLPRAIPAQATLERAYANLGESERQCERRDYSIIDLAYSCGLRRCELHALDIDDINEVEGVLRVRGKGGRDRVVPIGPRALKDLLHYIYEVRPLFIKGSSTPKALFVSWQKGGVRMHKYSINAAFRRLRKKHRFERALSPHALRHAFATDLVRNGAPVQDVSLMLGHVKLETTQVYTRLAVRDLKAHHAAHHPRQ